MTVAMTLQNYALYPHMSVYDNMAYGLKIRGLAKSDIDKRVNVAASILELGNFLRRRPRQLSGGQRQRVAMGRAMVREPAVYCSTSAVEAGREAACANTARDSKAASAPKDDEFL